MNEKAMTMKKEVRIISNYRALIVSKNFISFLLALSSLYLGYLRYALSPFYVLLVLNAFPPVLTFTFQDYANRYDNKILLNITKDIPFYLNSLKRKYQYSRVRYVTNSISYLLSLLFIGLWQFNYNTSEKLNSGIFYMPIFILVVGLLLRFLGIIFYRIKLPYDLSHNRV